MKPPRVRVPAGCPRCRTEEHHLIDVSRAHGHVASCDHCRLLWIPPAFAFIDKPTKRAAA